ncbi:MAG TPA: FkbM family methyltransferase [Methanocorpusculum sp.]|nr:FkbM family methyltransferase [Methanocorpusculum sp.]
MNNLRQFFAARKENGIFRQFYNNAKSYHKKYPDSKFFKEEYRYWKLLFYASGEATKLLGLDKKRNERENRIKKAISSISMKPITAKIGDFNLIIDDLRLIYFLILEYNDLVILDQFYEYNDVIKNKSGNYIDTIKSIFPNNENNDISNLKIPHQYFIDHIFRRMTSPQYILEGPYEIESVQIKPNDIVIDCGANIGLFSILSVKRGAEKVYAFDPQIRAQKLLNQNIKLNDCADKIIPVPFGLSDKKCTLSFVEYDVDIQSSHIERNQDKEHISDECNTTTIECVTIDDWVTENNIPKIDFIKADIEGSERYMLSGAGKTIKRDHPRLAICIYHLPDDPEVLKNIILEIDPTYHIEMSAKKLYAW